jgi:hypothetical protein
MNYSKQIRDEQSKYYKDPHEAYVHGEHLREQADQTNAAAQAERAARANGGDAEKKKKGWESHVFTAAALRTMEFPPISYVIPSLIPEGLAILAGRPKIGKSWAALDVAIGVASGATVLGSIQVEQGDVLYCALEDNRRRLQRRIRTLGISWPERLTLATQWRRLDQGGVEDIKAWCSTVEKPRLVLLDTLAGVRPPREKTDSLYDGDYKALRAIHQLANDRGMAAVALHHTRKMEADDPIDTISGTLGIAGAADTCLVLSRTPKGTTLYVRGRDVEEKEHAVVFNGETCRWSLLGDAVEVHRSETRKSILEVLAEATEALSPEQIAAATGIKRNAVDQRLYKMLKDGEVVQIGRGRYAHPDKAEMLTPHKKDKT